MSTFDDPLVLPSVLDHQLIFEESLVKIYRDQLQIDQNLPYSYYSLVTKPFAVAILAITAEGAYIVNEEYRHPTGRILLGCPCGFIEPEEEILEAARRELLEETGFQARSFTIIGSAFPYAGLSTQKTIYVRASEATLSSSPSLESSEIIRSRLLMPEDLIEIINTGVEVDGTLCTALFFHQHYRS